MASANRPREKEDSETSLEYALDTISGIPNELKRNLEHIADLHSMSNKVQRKLEGLEQGFLDRAKRRIREFPLPQVELGVSGGGIPVPTTEELLSVIDDPPTTQLIAATRATLKGLVSEKVSVAGQTKDFIEEHVKRITDQVQTFEASLKESGFYEANGAKPGDLVAINLGEVADEWILGKVQSFHPERSEYVIVDEDPDQPSLYTLPESSVMLLGNFDKLSKGDRIYAVYPDTTSFYQATVVAVKKSQGSQGTSVVYVNFLDDFDELGVTLDKPVALGNIMKM